MLSVARKEGKMYSLMRSESEEIGNGSSVQGRAENVRENIKAEKERDTLNARAQKSRNRACGGGNSSAKEMVG